MLVYELMYMVMSYNKTPTQNFPSHLLFATRAQFKAKDTYRTTDGGK